MIEDERTLMTIDELKSLAAEYALTLDDIRREEQFETQRAYAAQELEAFFEWLAGRGLPTDVRTDDLERALKACSFVLSQMLKKDEALGSQAREAVAEAERALVVKG